MRIFGFFEGERVPLELPEAVTVKAIKEHIWKILNIPEESGKQDKKVMVLTYGGSDLEDSWIFSDLGIRPGVTVKVSLQEEVKPVLFIHCAFNNNTIHLYKNLQVAHMTVSALKVFASEKTGIPVGVFRLVTRDGQEMFDAFRLEDYGIDVAHTVHMETWDGWNDFLKLAVLGYTGNVLAQLSTDEGVARYQMKVALYVAAHFGHGDLAVTLLRNGIRPSEPVGDHPTRQWCSENSHVNSLKTPVHEATENGQLGVLRTFVNHDIRCVLVRDGRGLTPMTVALRCKLINIVQFLVTKQWMKISVGKSKSISLPVYCWTRDWCDRAKERVFLLKGPTKSSLKKRPPRGALVSNGVIVDGYSPSQMNAKPKAIPRNDRRQRHLEDWQVNGDDPEMYFRRIQMYDRTIVALKTKRANRWGKMMDKAMVSINPFASSVEGHSMDSSITPTSERSRDDVSDSTRLKLPPILMNKPLRLPHHDLGSAALSDAASGTSPTSPDHRLQGTKKLKKRGRRMSASVPNIRTDDSSPAVSKRQTGSRSTFASHAAAEDTKSRPDQASVQTSQKYQGKTQRKARATTSAILLSNSKSGNPSFPLPVEYYDDTAHPKFYHSSTDGNIVESTLDLYEKYRGMKSRDYAIQCMTIANSFKEKPWLERVRIALNLTSKTVKKKYWEPRGRRRQHAQRSAVMLSTET